MTLLVTRVLANHHDVAMATNHLALVTHRLDAGAYLHDLFLVVAGLVPERIPGPFLIQWLLVPVNNAAAGQVIGTQLNNYLVFRQNSDVVLTHFPRNVSKNLVTVGQLDSEHRVRKGFDYRTFDFDDAVFVGHSLVSC